MNPFSALGGALLSFLYPPHCLLCEALVDDGVSGGVVLCPGCRRAIRSTSGGPRCPGCSLPHSDGAATSAADLAAGETERCPTCAAWPTDRSFQHVICLGAFDGPLREAIHLLKFNGHRKIGRLLGAGLVDAAPGARGLTALLPVPLHPARRRERGYNQAELIARGMAAASGTTLISDALTRRRATAQQAQTTSAEERERNLAGAFVARVGALAGLPDGASVGLVDDVLTTGATLDACGRAVRSVRPDLEIVAVVAAVAPKRVVLAPTR